MKSPPFVLQTDASSIGVGAILEQGCYVIAYASRIHAEQQYSVIQKECLAIIFALKQFRQYLLGRPFELWTDHALLQWLSSQKMEGLLCRWALSIQEFDSLSNTGKAVTMVTLMHYQGVPPLPLLSLLSLPLSS